MDTLLIEHRQEQQDRFCNALEASGSKVWIAPTSSRALEFLEHPFDLTVVNTGAPGPPPALDVVRKLKREQGDGEVIVIDQAPSDGDFADYQTLGVYRSLHEPVDLRDFELCLRHLGRVISLKQRVVRLETELAALSENPALGKDQIVVDDLWMEIFRRLKRD